MLEDGDIMIGELELLQLAFLITFMLLLIIAASLTLYMMFRVLRPPRAYPPPPGPSVSELARGLMCPKCGSKDLEQRGYYRVRCRACGFAFILDGEEIWPYHPGWWLWPIFWWPIFWFWPIILLRRR